MYYYIKTRKKGSLLWHAFRVESKIAVFNSYEFVKNFVDKLENQICEMVGFAHHPSDKKSPIHGKKFKQVDW
jgi:hypothetical protein